MFEGNYKGCVLCNHVFKLYKNNIIYGDDYRYVICPQCGHVFNSDRLLKNEYVKLGYSTQIDYDLHSKHRAGYIYNFIIKHISSLNTRSLNILDIGCGRGGVSYYLKKYLLQRGFDNIKLTGITLHEDDILNKYPDIDITLIDVDRDIDKFIYDKNIKYDLIIMSHVLEHVYEPLYLIYKIKNMMTLSGCLYVEVPSLYKASVRSKNIFVPVHTNYFTKNVLENIFINNNLTILKLIDSNWWGNIKCLVSNFDNTNNMHPMEKFIKIKFYLYKNIINKVFGFIRKFKDIGEND